MSNLPDTRALLQAGLRQMRVDHAEGERAKAGNLRGGNSGLLLPDGRVVGKCARQTYLRLAGEPGGDDMDVSREFMFAAGRTNEDSWKELLIKAGVEAERIRCEEEVPISWTLPSGRKVTGRPDLVIGTLVPGEGWKPQRGIELKLVSSLWTGRDVALKGQPKSMHLMQAGHYAYQLGVPFELWYTCRADFHIPYGKDWPNRGQPGSQYLEHRDDGKPLKMVPFVVGYSLRWREDRLQFKPVEAGEEAWVDSLVTWTALQAYYQLVDDVAAGKAGLPPRPVNLSATGADGGYSPCDYCSLQPVCDKVEGKGLDEWLTSVREWVRQLPATGSFQLD